MKTCLLTICAMFSISIGLQAQKQMRVNLKDGSSINVRASEIKKITWRDEKEATHEYVDLGLSVKWATCNVGASSPEEFGDYFAWGETEPKTTYNWSTYKWKDEYDMQTKYCTNSDYGTVDNKTTLELEDDAAHVNWGRDWRMPTQAELEELYYYCTWTLTTHNGVDVYKVTSNKNGNSIFLPAAGYRSIDNLLGAGSHGFYPSSSIDSSYSYSVQSIYFNSSEIRLYNYSRGSGMPVRAVCP